jgi:hypothetical protein
MNLTLQLSEEQVNALQAKAAEQGLSLEAWIVKLAETQSNASRPRPPIWEIIAERTKNVPPEDLAAMPEDGASQIDHYVYGVTKRAR